MGEGEEGSKMEGDSSFKNLHFMEHGRLDSLLGSCSVPGIDFFLPQPVLKILAQVTIKSQISQELL
jgi:hypothetical protein